MGETDRDGLDFDFSPAHCSERERLWEERGLSNRIPVSTAQSLRHHSIVCFTTPFFRHGLAARIPPLCRSVCADVTPRKEIFLPGFKISVDIVWVSSPQHLSVLSSRLLRIFLVLQPSPPASIAVLTLSCAILTLCRPLVIPFNDASFPGPYVYLRLIYSPEHVFPWDAPSPVKSYLDGFLIVTTVSISINLSNPLYGHQTLIYLAFILSRILLTLPKSSGIHPSSPAAGK
jgi:hypothetical protein